MKDKIILTDCDGVLLDWREGFLEWLPDHISDTLAVDALGQENFNNAFDYDQRHIDDLAHEFNESDAIKSLKPWRDAVEYVPRLADLGFVFHAYTAMGTKEVSHRLRAYNLYTLFGDCFDVLQCLPVGSSKRFMLEQYQGSGLFWIEDHIGHAQDGHALGLKSVLVSDMSNAEHTDLDFPRTSIETPWQDIYEMVLKEYKL